MGTVAVLVAMALGIVLVARLALIQADRWRSGTRRTTDFDFIWSCR